MPCTLVKSASCANAIERAFASCLFQASANPFKTLRMLTSSTARSPASASALMTASVVNKITARVQSASARALHESHSSESRRRMTSEITGAIAFTRSPVRPHRSSRDTLFDQRRSGAIIVQHAAGRSFNAWDCAQVFVHGTKISLEHTLKHGPGHDLQQIAIEGLESGEAIARDRG